MKHTKRKLLSLLLTLAMLFSLMSAGSAYLWNTYPYGSYDFSYGIEENVGISNKGGSANLTTDFPQYATYMGMPVVYTGQVYWDEASGNFTVSGSGTNATVSHNGIGEYYDNTTITAYALYYPCDAYGNVVYDYPVRITQTYNVVVGGTTTGPTVGGSFVPNYGSGTGSGSIGGTTSNSYVTAFTQGSMSLSINGNGSLGVIPYLSSNISVQNVSWSSSNSSVAMVNGSYTSASVSGKSAGTATIYADVSGYYYSGSSSYPFSERLACTVTVGTGLANTDLFISPSTLQVGVGSYDTLTASSYNATVQGYLSNVTWTSSNPSVASVNNSSLSNTATGSSIYVYGRSAGYATITATLTAISGQTYTATCDVVVGSGNTVDILYTTTPGTSLTLKTADFQKFWTDNNPYGTLSYVVFGTPTGTVGSLKYSNSYNQQVSATGQTFYVSPTSTLYNSLGSVTFVPTTYSSSYTYNNSGTLVVPFTAYGYTSSSTYATSNLSGQMYIMVTNGTVADINYQFSSTGVKLASTDFTNVYKSAVSTANTYPTYYIQFLDVPAFGSLYYNYYSNSIYTQNYGTKLTASNIGTMRFGNYSGAYSIDALTYIPGTASTGDTVRYIAYSSASGGTPLYMGEINFGKGAASANVVKYVSTANKTVSLDSDDFITDSNYYYGTYISFGTPSSGTLYKNSGTYVSSSDVFVAGLAATQTNSLDNVYFVPKTGFTGVVEIPYTASNYYTGGQISGTVKLYYSKTFSDVKADWAYDYIMQMAAEGIVTGKTSTTFDPDGKVTYGEALKMIMLATGYKEQANGTKHWADNYLALAKSNNLVASTLTSGDLNKAIDRNAVASIAAKALGLKAVTATSATPFADSNDGYVLALYNAGIVEGSTVGTKTYYYGSNDISRKEISKIICLVSDYNG